MLRKDLIPGERFHVHDRVRALVAEVEDLNRGPQILLSRTHRNFLRRLLETEVPEIFHGIVEIRSITREPGQRAKVAVSATQSGIDPVGACVGLRGVRIQAIVRELHDEKIDVIEWHQDPSQFIARAISPAKVSGVFLNEFSEGGKTATVVVPEDQLSLAIGRDGQNARLAAKLTSWRIDIKSLPEAASDALFKLQNDLTLAELAAHEKENVTKVEEILAKKASGGIINAENYDYMIKFVERIEKRSFLRSKEEEAAEKKRMDDLRSKIPARFFETEILDSGLPEHVNYILQEAGYNNLSDLVVQMLQQPDNILRLNGMGPRAMKSIEDLMAKLPELVEQEREALATEKLSVQEEEAVAPTIVEEEKISPEDELILANPISEPEEEKEIDYSDTSLFGMNVEKPVEIVKETKVTGSEKEEELSFDQLFALQADVTEYVAIEEEEEEGIDKKDKKKKDKKKRHVEVTYNEEEDLLVYRKKHKHEGDEWADWE